MDFNLGGLEDLIVYLMKWLVEDFDVRTIDSTTVAELLTTFAPIWNPIWEAVNKYLNEWFGF